jgi:glycosyltransferase involved in cell wall biosynthesis
MVEADLTSAAVDRGDGRGVLAAITPAGDWASTSPAELPLVSVVLTTRDRPDFFPVALACYRHQTYVRRELVVVDDGDRFPVDPRDVAAEGGRLIRTGPGTPLGTKLNVGIAAARGYLCLKMDDDDWYGPGFVETMMARQLAEWRDASRATLVGAAPFLIFDLARWEIVRTVPGHTGGGSLVFRREDWEACPFRPVKLAVDLAFLGDQAALGTRLLPVKAPEDYLAIRHGGAGHNRGHTWIDKERYIAALPRYRRTPEQVLPTWTIAYYRDLRRKHRARADAGDAITRLARRIVRAAR